MMASVAEENATVSIAGSKADSASDLLDVVISQRVTVADGVIALRLVPQHGKLLPSFTPGAHIDVHIASGLMRQYSLCGDPANNENYRLGIKLEPASRGGSASIHRSFDVGTKLRIGKPRNLFPLADNASKTFLVAGGIGVTPMLAMAHALRRTGADFELLYSARTRSSAAFLNELEKEWGNSRLHVHIDDENGQRFSAPTYTPSPVPGAHLYVCGPGPFMDAVLESARQKDWQADRLHSERFTAEPVTGGEQFDVVAARSGVTVAVRSDQTIAEALQAAGVEVALSCEQGVCGLCLVPVIEGQPDHRDVYQTDSEKASDSQIAICCSRARSARLVLDV
jgi:vanillate O-demethylase ferredoxin subunit